MTARIQLPPAIALGERARTRFSAIGGVVLCTLGALAATFPHSPANMPYVYPDGGVFLYVAQQMRQGALLYREVWDHKPPLIYYINLVGLSMTNGSRWGLWGLEFAAVVAAVLCSYFLLKRAFGQALGLLVTGVWLLAFFALIEDGNLTETFALPFQFLCLAIACEVETKHGGSYRWRGVLIGILLAIIFWLKPNEIGIGLAIGLYIVLRAARQRAWRAALINLGVMLAGFGLVTMMVLIPFALQGTLKDLYDTVFVFNAIYSRRFAFIASRIDELVAGYQYLSATVLMVLGILGFIVGVNVLLWARTRLSEYHRTLLALSALALPIEIVLVTASGRSFDHYFVALLYVLAVWTAWFLWVLNDSILLWLRSNMVRTRRFVTAGFILGVVAASLPALDSDIGFAQKLHAIQPSEIVAYIQTHTTPQDTVAVWGLETRLLFFADRRAPTKFPHTIAFEFPLYATPQVVENYFAEILARKPKLIIDPREYGLNNFTPAQSHKLYRQINRLRDMYHPVGKIGGMTVYLKS